MQRLKAIEPDQATGHAKQLLAPNCIRPLPRATPHRLELNWILRTIVSPLMFFQPLGTEWFRTT